ncbi:U-box domain-containing protein 34-like [Andrographis paniculata]|uniref:U-box domain-containing protein 34-like n=1 Tax=Andrographis paniculata TaxID=175694 RepID=UPI0021E6ED9A|nr:U-box domain-containing protein 34-like [Andrographis paniculata]
MLSDEKDHIYVCVDKDKHSTIAVRWAIDQLVTYGQTLVLIHVRIKHGVSLGEVNCGLAEEPIFAPFRAYCARKSINVREVVLEGGDVHNTLLEYINKHHITSIVLGSSSRNALARRFWSQDIATLVNKAAPDFCSVYIISKGKAQSIRPRHASSSSPPQLPHPKLNRLETDTGSRGHLMNSEKRSMDHHAEMLRPTSRGSSARNLSNLNQLDIDFLELDNESSDITRVEIPSPARMGTGADAEDNGEVQRLKLEVKQTMNMYKTACKQAVSAQHRVDELQQIKVDEKNRIEQARLAEEAALALVEMEKAKCRAAIEAAEKAQRIAEKEAQRRKYAEQRAEREAEAKNRALDVLSQSDVRYRKYSIEEIKSATNEFSSSMKIGEGGYGPVYKGKLDHTPVAIKVLRPDAVQGRKQFQQEVEILSCIRHPNMVLLLGACPEYGCLVYEFMDSGSLEDRLFRKGNTPPIPWGIRFKIAADIATSLLFLHQAKPEPLVHRDLKPANILLDHNFTCKISDVGLARLVPPSVADSVTQYHMTSAAGTFCYIDPEYQQTGKLGTKSDIYSLGVMLLQIITAKPPMGLTHYVERAIQKGTFADLLDAAVPDWPVEETLGYAKLALKCVELRKKDRPDLGSEILPELERLKEFGMKQHV